MQILAQYPIRNRRESFFKTLAEYRRLAENPSKIEYHVVFDSDDPVFMSEEVQVELLKVPYLSFSIQTAPATKISACNYRVGNKVFDIVLLVSDDMVPVVRGWDTILREQMEKLYPDTDGVLWFNDGYQGRRLNTLCILGRRYYDRFGYIYHPSYKTMYCDNEFMLVAARLGKQTYFDDVIIEHRHPDTGARPADSLYARNGVPQGQDAALFEQRRALGFPGDVSGGYKL